MNQQTVDYHCKQIRESISSGSLIYVTCLNYLKNYASSFQTRKDWQWVGSQLVMSGWLTVNAENDFEVRT